MTLPPIDNVLGRLDGVRKDGSGWSARCPCRQDDHNPSLHIGLGNDERVLLTCHRGGGCNLEEICAALELTVAELHPEPLERESRPARKTAAKKPAPAKKPNPRTQPTPTLPDKSQQKLTLTDTWDYRDEHGTLLFQKRRFVDEAGHKTYRQRRPDPTGGWINNLGDTPQVLYRLPQIVAAVNRHDTIWVVEGERDADTLVEHHFEATTMPGGAGKWRDLHTQVLAGADIVIVADNDRPGRDHARSVATALTQAGSTVHLLIAPDPHKDVTDLLAAGLTLDDLLELAPDPEPDEPAIPTVAETDQPTLLEPAPEPASNPTVAETPETLPADPLHVPEAEWDALVDGVVAVLDDPALGEEQRLVKARRLLERASPEARVLDPTVLSWAEFVQGEDDPYDWLIPGVLERGERVIVVAEEGAGKTFLMRQVALCTAAGVHPFTKSRMDRIKTLTVDLENPERIIRRTSKEIVQSIRLFTKETPDAGLVIKPAGLNLLKAEDRVFLEKAIERAEPDLVCMGPLYKAFVDPGGRTSEAIAVEVAKYLDELRDRYRISWWLEHHAPLGDSMRSRDLRPFGSAVWSRWPEFGLALHHDPTEPHDYIYEVKHFRGARDARHWPLRMKRGGQGNLPFEVLTYLNS